MPSGFSPVHSSCQRHSSRVTGVSFTISQHHHIGHFGRSLFSKTSVTWQPNSPSDKGAIAAGPKVDPPDTWSVSSVALAELSLCDFLTGLRPQQCLKLLNCLRLEFFHVVFLDQGWPQTTEIWERETVGCGLGGVGLLYLISCPQLPY